MLVEFMPKSKNLLGLNVNGGQKICVRLRDANAPTSFLPYDHILGTLLHELVHIVHGPHAAPFYKLLDELTDECEQLMAQGVTSLTSEPFAGRGEKLAPGLRPIPRHKLAERAAE